jgi:hypothetical protein
MSRIDDELQRALSREEPSPQFTDNVMARVAALRAEPKERKTKEGWGWLQSLIDLFQPPGMKLVMAAVVLCLSAIIISGILRYREDQRQQALAEVAKGEKAKEEVVLAMRIAIEKLNFAQKKVLERVQFSHEGEKHE